MIFITKNIFMPLVPVWSSVQIIFGTPAEKRHLHFPLRRPPPHHLPFKLPSVCFQGLQVCRGRRRVRLASTCPGDWPVSLLPQRDAVTGANLFGILEKARRAGDDPTGQPAEGRETQETFKDTCRRPTQEGLNESFRHHCRLTAVCL